MAEAERALTFEELQELYRLQGLDEYGYPLEEDVPASTNRDVHTPSGQTLGKVHDAQDDDAWDPPVPLGPTGPLPPFPLDALPGIFADQVAEVAEFTQTDPGMAGASAIAVLGACAGGRCEIEVRSGWREPLGIYVATVAEPGERKSAVQATMVAPLTVAERALMDQARGQILEAEVAKDVAKRAAERAKQAAGNSDGPNHDLAANAVSAAMAAEAIIVPTVPRIIADDVTPEAAASLMVDQGGRLAIISAEGGIFDIIAGRYSGNVPNLDVFLKGHSGDPLKVDRKGRAPEYVPRPTMTVGIMVQPAVLDALGRNGTFRGRGLLARFLFVLPPSKVGRRIIDPDPVREAVRDQYDATVTKLATTLAGWVDPAILTLDHEATELIFDHARRTEPRLGPGGDLHGLRDWGSKMVGATARLAGLLHLATNPEHGWRQPVTADTVSKAIRLADFFTAHAVRAFATMATDPLVADATYLVEIIVRIGKPAVSRRDLFNAASRSRFPKAYDLDPVIGLLEDHGHLAPVAPPERTGPGRPPSPVWTVNPHVLAAETA